MPFGSTPLAAATRLPPSATATYARVAPSVGARASSLAADAKPPRLRALQQVAATASGRRSAPLFNEHAHRDGERADAADESRARRAAAASRSPPSPPDARASHAAPANGAASSFSAYRAERALPFLDEMGSRFASGAANGAHVAAAPSHERQTAAVKRRDSFMNQIAELEKSANEIELGNERSVVRARRRIARSSQHDLLAKGAKQIVSVVKCKLLVKHTPPQSSFLAHTHAAVRADA